MGQTSYRYLVYSVKQSLKEYRDDADLDIDSIIFWTQVEVNRLRGERLSKRHIQSGEYLSHFTDISVVQDRSRKYVVMPSAILDLENENGVHQVTYLLEDFDYCDSPLQVPFEKTMPAKIWSLRADPLREPKPSRAFMAREGSKLYLYGIELINVKFVEMWLYTTVSTLHKLNLDDTVELSDEQISILLHRVLDLVRFALLMPNDKSNTGSDGNTVAQNKTALSQAQIQTQEQQNQQ